MSWVKVDDKAWSHPKFAELSGNAVRLWLFALCWCNQQETDGAIPKGALRLLGGTAKDSSELVRAGLWHVTEQGWSVHDFLTYQPSKAQRNAQREATSERVKRYRTQHGNASDASNVTLLHSERERDSNTAPVPDPGPVPGDPKAAEDDPGTSQAFGRAAAGTAAVAAAEPTRGDFASLERALKLPIRLRADHGRRFMAQDSTLSTFARPEAWPEVIDLAKRFSSALGCSASLGTYARDSGVRTLVELLATFAETELTTAIDRAKNDEFVRGKGLSVLSVEVVRQLVQGGRPKARERPGFVRRETVQPNHGVNPFALVPQE